MKAFRTETLELQGKKFLAEFFRDKEANAPWEYNNLGGSVRIYNKFRVEKKPCERVLGTKINIVFFYDFQEACLKRKRILGLSRKEASEETEKEFRFYKAWLGEEWFYMKILLTELVEKNGKEVKNEDNRYLIQGVESFRFKETSFESFKFEKTSLKEFLVENFSEFSEFVENVV